MMLGLAVMAALLASGARGPGASPVAQEDRFEEDAFAWLVVPPRVAPRKQRWVADLAAAKSEARARNCPVLVVIAEDQSSGFRVADTAVLSHSVFDQITHQCVVVAAIGGGSLPVERKKVQGVTVDWCERFQLPRMQRQQAFELATQEFMRREYWQPAYVLVQPDGVESTRIEGHKHQVEDVVELVEELQAEIGRGLPHRRYRRILSDARRIVDRREKTGRGAALDALREEQRGWRTAGLTELARRIERQILAEGRRAVGDALRLAAGDEDAAIERLEQLVEEWGERPPGMEAREALRRLGGRGEG